MSAATAPQQNDEDDAVRLEESWTVDNEWLLRRWMASWKQQRSAHSAAAGRQRRLSYIIAVPSAALPMLASPLAAANVMNGPGAALAFACSGLLAALNGIFQFAVTAAGHQDATQHYSELITDTEELLCKGRKYRPDCDLTINDLKRRWDCLIMYSPAVPVPVHDPGVPGGGPAASTTPDAERGAGQDAAGPRFHGRHHMRGLHGHSYALRRPLM